MTAMREAYKLLRWRFVPIRYAGKVRRTVTDRGERGPARSRVAQTIHDHGFTTGPTIPAPLLDEIQAIYRPRGEAVVPSRNGGHPFTNLMRAEDFTATNPVLRFALSSKVLDAAHDYFGGRFICDSIQVLYSWPTHGELCESQKWHKDFGDNQSFHCVAYVNDVLDDADGPFVFIDKHDTRRIGASPFIRRIADDRFAKELSSGQVRTFCGKAGESVLIDPAQCYHYGSRCERPRIAIFATFSTDRPFTGATPIITDNVAAVRAAAAAIRPDLSDAYIARLFPAS